MRHFQPSRDRYRQPSRRAILQFALPAIGGQPQPELRYLAPPDSPIEDSSLRRFLDGLSNIVSARDYKRLEALMLPSFRVDFDRGKGPAVFHEQWAPRSHESPVWAILSRILALGGATYSKTLYAAPYVFVRFPIDLEPLAHVVATESDVPLRSSPAENAEAAHLVTHAILPLAHPLSPPVFLPVGGFLEVRLPDTPPSFVSSSDVYSPAGYRIFIEKRGGQWRWISLACATLAYPPDLKKLEEKSRRSGQ